MKTVTIDRKCWGRGEYYNKNGRCCAIGFIAKTELQRSGKKHINSNEINCVANNLMNLPQYWNIVGINDNQSGKQRQKNLIQAFKKIGYKLVFKN